MSTIVTRAGKGSALTHNEVDANFNNLNNDKIEAAQSVTLTNKTISGSDNTLSNIGNSSLTNSSVTLGSTSVSLGSTATTVSGLTLTSPTVNTPTLSGGTINNASVGATTPSSGSFTSLTDSGNLTFTGTGSRITGDFSNATVANRVMFQTSTSNSLSRIGVIPSGSSQQAHFEAFNNSDPTNSSTAGILCGAAESRVYSAAVGTGTALPMTFYTGGSERMRIDTSGNVGIGTSGPSYKLDVQGGTGSFGGSSGVGAIRVAGAGGSWFWIDNPTTTTMRFSSGATAGSTTNMTLDSSGNVGIGTSSPAARLDVRGSSTFLINATNPTAWVSVDSALTTGSVYTQWNTSTNEGVFGSYTNHPIYFVTNNARRLTIDTSGNVGIGTSSPGALLNVNYNSASFTTIKISNSVTGNTSSDGFDFVCGASGEAYVYNRENQPLIFGTNNTERARIDASGFTQFSSNLVMPYQGAPTSKSGAATLTGAELITGILNTTGTTYTITLPTGTNIEGALTWSANNVSLDWWVINTASGTITIGANGNTTLGSLTIATGTSAQFRIRRTATNTFTVYRLG